MERLTYPLLRDSENQAYDSKYGRETLLHRLAAYEDTGLTPEEILDPVEMAKVAIAIKENTRLREQLTEVTAERDAAVEDMKRIVDAVREEHCDETCCFACAYDCDTSITDSGCYANECPGFDRDDCFEWRGLRKED